MEKILGVRDALIAEAENADQTTANTLRTELNGLTAELEALQGETPLMRVFVDASDRRRSDLGLDRYSRGQDDERRDSARCSSSRSISAPA